MAEKRGGGEVWLTIGALWIALTGMCTFNVWRSGDYLGEQFAMFFGAPIVALGLIPLLVGFAKRGRSKSR